MRTSRHRFDGNGCRGLLLALIMAAAVLAWTRPAYAATRLINAVVASIDGDPVTLHEFETFKKKRGPLLPPEQLASEDSVLDALVMTRVFHAEFEANGIDPPDSEVERYIDQIIPRTGSSREQILSTLKELGLEWNDYFERMREEVQRFELINREIRSRVNVTPEEIEAHWKNDPEYEQPERIECAHIFIPFPSEPSAVDIEETRRLAADAHTQARRSGSAFEKAAKRYSKAPSAAAGGYLGTFRRGTMSPLYEKLLSSLKAGEVSEAAEDEAGIHIVKLVAVLPRERVPLDEVRDEIRQQLYDEMLEARFKRWVQDDLRGRHHITVHLADLAGMTSE